MDLPLITKVLTHINVDAYGTDIITGLILVVHASNFGIMDKVKYKLTATKLYDFPGEKFELYCDNQLGILQLLDDSRFIQPQHLSCLTRPLTRCTILAFQLWSLNQNKGVSEFFFKTQDMDFSLIPEADCLYLEDIFRLLR